jgi:hypothetical protein
MQPLLPLERIKCNMMWIVTFDEDNSPKPGEQLSLFSREPIERLCLSEEITLIEQ